MKKRNFKFSLGMKIASILSCLAIVSMGFASWWIVKIDDKTVVGDFEVYSADIKNIVFDMDENHTPAELVFGKPASNAPTGGWLVADSINNENLTTTIKFDVYVANEEGTADGTNLNTLLDKINITFAPKFAEKFNTAIRDGYITAPTISASYTWDGNTGSATEIAGVSYQYTEVAQAGSAVLNFDAPSQNKITVTLTITFDWGTAFNANIDGVTKNYNPHIFYNKTIEEPTSDQINAAKTALMAIYNISDSTDANTETGANADYVITLDATTN